jgi:hypothetical protein
VAERSVIPTLAGAALLVGVAWMLSKDGQARIGAQLHVAARAGAGPAPGASGSMSIRTGITPAAWTPYMPPDAHLGPHRMYQHPATASPYFSHLTTAPDAYDWMFCPPSEGDL